VKERKNERERKEEQERRENKSKMARWKEAPHPSM
jgi:hypothetical protein